MPQPLISVVMPVYNGRAYLTDAVESILAQTLADFELIVVDDGSTDGSAQMLEQLAQRDPRIVLVRQANAGGTRAMNQGVAHARGEYVARMDADDLSLPTRFARQVEYLGGHPECVAVGSAVVMIDPEGNPLCEERWPLEHEEIDGAALAGRNDGGLPHPAAMIRAFSLRALGGYREKFPVAQDKDLWLRLAEVGRLANLPDVLVKYRVHGGSTGATKAARQRAAFDEAIADACRRRGIPVPPRAKPRKSWFPTFADPTSQLAMYAIRGCNFPVARRHARSYLCQKPLSPRAWFLAGLALSAPLIQRLRGKRSVLVRQDQQAKLEVGYS